MTTNNKNKIRRYSGILALNLMVGIGAYFVAWQFNDGKLNAVAFGSIFLAMALPNLLIGGVTRMFRPELGRYFLRLALFWVVVGTVLIWRA